jgi:hypothetical protein
VILDILAAVAKGTCSGGPGHHGQAGSSGKGVVVVMVAILAAVLRGL